MEDVTLTLYQVSKCGYFVDEEFKFANVVETLQAFREWTGGLGSVGESSTYAPDEDDDILRAFCLDIRELGVEDRWLVVTWNELARVEDGVQVVETNSKIGDPHVSAVDIGAQNIPGYPAYFCVDATTGDVLNLRFDQRLNGSRQFQRFIQGFLASASPWCVWNEDDETELLGYEEDDEGIDSALRPEFATRRVKVASREDFIRENVDRIRKVIRKASVDPETEEHKIFLDSAFKLLGLPVNNRLKAEIPFTYEFKTRLTEEKLGAIIQEYDRHRDNPWDDVGFTFSRESQKVHWLSGSIARSKQSIDVTRLEEGMIEIDSLVEYLNEHFDAIREQLTEGDE